MSSKGTILTTSDEHWYEDFSCLSKKSTPEKQIPNIFMEINTENIVSIENLDLENCMIIEIDGACDLAMKIRSEILGRNYK